jgi:hypothetical protein
VLVGQRLRRADDLVQVRVHELIDQINVVELVAHSGFLDVLDGNQVLVAQVPQQLDLTQRASGVGQVLEGVACSSPTKTATRGGETPNMYLNTRSQV